MWGGGEDEDGEIEGRFLWIEGKKGAFGVVFPKRVLACLEKKAFIFMDLEKGKTRLLKTLKPPLQKQQP